MVAGVRVAAVGLSARRNPRPGFYAQTFPTVNGQHVEAETQAFRTALKSHGMRVRTDWPARFTFGRGGGPGIPSEVVEPVLLGIGFLIGSYAQGFVGQIGAEHSIAIRQTIKEWLEGRPGDDFYLAIETPGGQQVRALFPSSAAFTEAYDALDDALKHLPKLAPDGFCLIEWDDNKHRWVQPL